MEGISGADDLSASCGEWIVAREIPYGGIDQMLPRFIHQEFYSKNNWRENLGKSKIDPTC
jgi:hypothetical protein